MESPLYLGIDGGGTGCRARIEDVTGRRLGGGRSGPATLRLGAENTMASVSEAAIDAIRDAGLAPSDFARISVGVVLAGYSRKGVLGALRSGSHSYATLTFASDAEGALLGAHSGGDGAVVIAGTGSIGLGIVAGRRLRVGGYGFPVSDEGSGAWIGLRSVQTALRGQDGRAPVTSLVRAILSRFEGDVDRIVAWMDGATATDYAGLAPLVLDHARGGDDCACQIVHEASRQIASLIAALVAKGAPRVALVGGMAGPLASWLPPEAKVVLKPADGDAIAGAIILAKAARCGKSAG